MKVDDAVETIAKFFNDLIGALVPGLVFTLGLAILHFGIDITLSLSKIGESTSFLLISLGLLFALGHILIAAYDHLINPILKQAGLSKKFNELDSQNRQSYIWFNELVKVQQVASTSSWSFHDLRSVALSVSSEAASLGRRFMFISLLCSGVSTALILLGLDYILCVFFQPGLLYQYEQTLPWYIWTILIIGIALLLVKQSNSFYARAMTTPFSMAVAELKFKKASNAITS